MDIVYFISLFLTIIIVCVLMVLLARRFHVDGRKAKYDERQILARGRGYKFAFYATLVASFTPIALPDNILHFLGDALYAIPVFVGLVVYVSYCIWNDAYLELNLNIKSWIIYMILIGLFNTFLFLSHFKEGYVKDGVINISVVNLMMAIICVAILVQLVFKNMIDKKREADEDEELEA